MLATKEEELKKILPNDGPSISEVKKYLDKYSEEYIVIKCGGSVLINKNLFNIFINDIVTLKKLGFIVPETFQVQTNINGDKYLMLFQEKAAKELLERNNKREGPIFEGDESLLWSQDNRDNSELEDLSLSRLTNYKWFLRGQNSEYIVLKAFDSTGKETVPTAIPAIAKLI